VLCHAVARVFDTAVLLFTNIVRLQLDGRTSVRIHISAIRTIGANTANQRYTDMQPARRFLNSTSVIMWHVALKNEALFGAV